MDHLLGVGSGESLDVGALGFGQLIAQPEDLGHRVGLLLDRLGGSLVFLPHGDDHERQKHGVDHTQSRVDETSHVVVPLAQVGWNEAMDQLEPSEGGKTRSTNYQDAVNYRVWHSGDLSPSWIRLGRILAAISML